MSAPSVDLTNLATFRDGPPMAWFAWLRANEPVHWHETRQGPGFWLVTKHADVQRISRDWQTFSSEAKHGGIMGLTEAERTMVVSALAENMLPTMDPPEHTQHRKVVAGAMMPGVVAETERYILRLSHELLDSVVDQGTVEFVKAVAMPLPLQVLAEMANLPIRDRDQIFRWVNLITMPDDPDFGGSPEDYARARGDMQNYCREIYAERSKCPGNDIVSMMISGTVDGRPVTPSESVSFFELLVGAGSETTRNTLSHGLRALAQFPEQWEKLKAEPERLIESAAEEMLRWSTPVMYFHRAAMKDAELRGVKIAAGDSVILSYMSANFDEDVFGAPESFDIERISNRHLSFGGGGIHNCLGANLARLEVRTFLKVLIERVQSIEITGNPVRVESNLMNSLKRMPVSLKS